MVRKNNKQINDSKTNNGKTNNGKTNNGKTNNSGTNNSETNNRQNANRKKINIDYGVRDVGLMDKGIHQRKKLNPRVVFGYFLIFSGLLLPLYAFLSLSFDEINKAEEYKTFITETTKDSPEFIKGMEKYNESVSDTDVTFVDPFSNEEYKRQYEFYKKNPDKAFAYLRIPTIDVEMPIYLDASEEHLAMGAAHVDGTFLPIGRNGRSVIAGHRGFYKKLMFWNLDFLKDGDPVFVDRGGETYEYEVFRREVIEPYEWDKLKPSSNEDILTLLTCEPKRLPMTKRLLIDCRRVRYRSVFKRKSSDGKYAYNNVAVEPTIKWMKYGIFSITVFLILVFVWFLRKFLIYITDRRDNFER